MYYTNVRDFSLKKVPAQIQKLLVQSDEQDNKHYFYYLYPKNLNKAPRGVIDFASNNRLLCLEYIQTDENICVKSVKGVSDSIILQDILELILKDIFNGMFFLSVFLFLSFWFF